MKAKSLGVVAVLLLSGLFISAAEEKKPLDQFEEVVKATDALKDCRVKFQLYSFSGKNQKTFLSAFEEAKYLHNPRLYYQYRSKVEANYKEQAQAGFQEIYRGDRDLTEILMPGAFRALGLISLLPEDPKGFGMNGGNLKTMAPWDMTDWFARMARIGKVSMEKGTRNNKPCLLFDIVQDPGTYYFNGVNRVRLFADEKSLLPVRFEWWFPGMDQPGSFLEYSEFAANTGLKPEDFAFQGFKSPFSLIKSPPASEIDPYLKPTVRTRLPDPPPDPQAALEAFYQAADAISSYRADLSMRFRYGRLRLFREDRFAYNRKPYWFTLVTTAQKADYLLLNHSAGAVLWIDPSDHNFHIIGGGVQRILGEQIFSSDDYKFYSSLGDNPYELNFPGLAALLKNSFGTRKPEAWMVDYSGRKMCELKFERSPQNLIRAPSRVNVVFDPETNLPRVIELSGYDDPKAYMVMAIDNIKINILLQPRETKF